MEHYYNEETKTISNEKEVIIRIDEIELKFLTDNGVFSKKGLDFGTRTLLKKLKNINGKVLDFGCGYGPIGIYIAKKYKTDVTMLDINERAVNLAKKNCLLNNVKCEVIKSNMYESINELYDYIVTNPPIRIGKEKLYKILFEAKNYLKDNGKLYLVINKNQGAKSLARDLQKIYKIDIIEKNKGFYVILASK